MVLLCFLAFASLLQQARSSPAATPSVDTPAGRVMLDHIVAIANGQLIMQSDVDEEKRFSAFEPFRDQSTVTEEQLVDRLIDRALILQQLAEQPQAPIPDVSVDAEIATLRKTIPACVALHCETEAGWQKFVVDNGFTLDELRERWRMRMEVLQFIEARFRTGVLDTITPQQVDEYYRKTLLPAYAKQSAVAPPEDAVAARIQEVLLQQQVNKLLDEWLKSLRAEGSVRILQAGEIAP